MNWTKYRLFLAILLVISGTASTLLSKWTTTEKAKNSIGIEENFNHPFLQASGYFLGEFLCLIIYYGYKFVQRQYVSLFSSFGLVVNKRVLTFTEKALWRASESS